MRRVSVTDADQGFAALLDAALREPVLICRQGQDMAVLISVAEYRKVARLYVEEFQRFADMIGERAVTQGMTEEMLGRDEGFP